MSRIIFFALIAISLNTTPQGFASPEANRYFNISDEQNIQLVEIEKYEYDGKARVKKIDPNAAGANTSYVDPKKLIKVNKETCKDEYCIGKKVLTNKITYKEESTGRWNDDTKRVSSSNFSTLEIVAVPEKNQDWWKQNYILRDENNKLFLRIQEELASTSISPDKGVEIGQKINYIQKSYGNESNKVSLIVKGTHPNGDILAWSSSGDTVNIGKTYTKELQNDGECLNGVCVGDFSICSRSEKSYTISSKNPEIAQLPKKIKKVKSIFPNGAVEFDDGILSTSVMPISTDQSACVDGFCPFMLVQGNDFRKNKKIYIGKNAKESTHLLLDLDQTARDDCYWNAYSEKELFERFSPKNEKIAKRNSSNVNISSCEIQIKNEPGSNFIDQEQIAKALAEKSYKVVSGGLFSGAPALVLEIAYDVEKREYCDDAKGWDALSLIAAKLSCRTRSFDAFSTKLIENQGEQKIIHSMNYRSKDAKTIMEFINGLPSCKVKNNQESSADSNQRSEQSVE